MITEFAPAKINLYLHVTGRRADGYHELDSLVVFAKPGSAACDRIELEAASSYSLRIAGPEARGLQGEDVEKNLITRAVRALSAKIGKTPDFRITLYKHLPVASGIGGGSADAAAALRAAAKLWKLEANHPAITETARMIGDDVYPCLLSQPCFFEGSGKTLSPASGSPRFFLLLVNPNIPLPTAEVFAARQSGFSKPAGFKTMPSDIQNFIAELKKRRNDLQEAACELCEAITHVLDMLEGQEGCLLARMSGSGATCFGIFADQAQAEQAAEKIRRQIREHWLAVTEIG